MEQIICEECDKIIEGYNRHHVGYLLDQHKLTHRYKEKKLQAEKEESK